MKDLVTFTEEILNGKLLIFLKNFYAMMCMKTKIVIQNCSPAKYFDFV